MSKRGINERIINGIQLSESDENIKKFLIDILYEEIEHSGHWWYKETYKNKIQECIEDWRPGVD